ncbi:MAG: hypothetical protein LBP25_00850 [Tannerellaceae bacterium]|nr:hypothetical protein [Tannerellaceae bacterium]
MKHKALFLSFVCICLTAVCKGQSSNPAIPEGVWRLENVDAGTNSSPFKRLQGHLPADLYYTCPEKIEIKNESECLFYFDNGETKKVFQYVYAYQGKHRLRFSFEGQTSIPERQYAYIVEKIDGQSFYIVFENAEEVTGSPAVSYRYHYSFIQ